MERTKYATDYRYLSGYIARANLSKKALAEKLNLSQTGFYRYFTQKLPMPGFLMYKIIDILNLNEEETFLAFFTRVE